MTSYTHEYSNFPEELIALGNYKDVDDTVKDLIYQIDLLRQQGKYAEAQAMVEKYSSQLSSYNLSMSVINGIIENIRNTQIRSISAGQFLSIDIIEPASTDLSDGFVWLGGD